MALLIPSLPERITMDATKSTIVDFVNTGSEQHTGYDIEIYEGNVSSTPSQTISADSTEKSFTISANLLVNGKTYKLRIRTKRSNRTSGWSEYCTVICYTEPTCTINALETLDGKYVVRNQNYTFEGEYMQTNGIKLQSYYFVLYSKNGSILQTYEKVYPRSASANEICVQKVEGLDAETEYSIELICTDKYGKEISSGRYVFVVYYDKPRFTQFVEIENEESTASVKMEASMIQIIFEVDSKTPVFIDKQELDLRNDRAYNKIYNNGTTRLNIAGDFTLKLYCRNIQNTVSGEERYFLTLTSGDKSTQIKLKEMDNRIHAYKVITFENSDFPISSHYVSDEISGYVKNSSSLVIQLNQTGGRLDVYAQKI